MKKQQRKNLPGSLKRGPYETSQKKVGKQYEYYSGRFPKGVQQKGNPTMTTSTVTAMRKGDPQHMLREKETTETVTKMVSSLGTLKWLGNAD